MFNEQRIKQGKIQFMRKENDIDLTWTKYMMIRNGHGRLTIEERGKLRLPLIKRRRWRNCRLASGEHGLDLCGCVPNIGLSSSKHHMRGRGGFYRRGAKKSPRGNPSNGR
jgi:hypothetical protein